MLSVCQMRRPRPAVGGVADPHARDERAVDEVVLDDEPVALQVLQARLGLCLIITSHSSQAVQLNYSYCMLKLYQVSYHIQ